MLFNVASSSFVEAIRLSFRDQAHLNTNLSEQYASSSKLQFLHISLLQLLTRKMLAAETWRHRMEQVIQQLGRSKHRMRLCVGNPKSSVSTSNIDPSEFSVSSHFVGAHEIMPGTASTIPCGGIAKQPYTIAADSKIGIRYEPECRGGMNMKRFAVIAVVALGALLTTAPGAWADNTSCITAYSTFETVAGDLQVPDNATCIFQAGASVTGNVTVGQGAAFVNGKGEQTQARGVHAGPRSAGWPEVW